MPRVIQTALATLLTSIALQTTAFAASVNELADAAQLQVRDVDQDGVADAYYSTALNLTWLADANLAATTGAAPYGLFNKDEADKWAQDASPWGAAPVSSLFGLQRLPAKRHQLSFLQCCAASVAQRLCVGCARLQVRAPLFGLRV